MSDTDNNQNNQQNTNRTFTQDELNAILQTRLADERKKYADYDSLKERLESMMHRKKQISRNFRRPMKRRRVCRRRSMK